MSNDTVNKRDYLSDSSGFVCVHVCVCPRACVCACERILHGELMWGPTIKNISKNFSKYLSYYNCQGQ